MNPKPLNAQGFTFVELALAALILATLAGAVVLSRSLVAKQTVRASEKAYAGEKAIQMFEELRALVGGNEKAGVAQLDDYSDGTVYNEVLTTDKTVDVILADATRDPGDPLSGNRRISGFWKYMRQIEVKRVPNDIYVRQVVVKVYRAKASGQVGELLATVGGMLRTLASPDPPTQEMDVYILAVENISAWWAVLPRLKNTMVNVLDDLEDRNPGLKFRTHFISRAAFGRDTQYLPFINSTTGSHSLDFPWVYLYPGKVQEEAPPNGSGTLRDFFEAGNEGIYRTGNFNDEGSIIYTDSSQFSSCPQYTVADQFNHGMRYPDEEALYQAVSLAAVAAGQTPPEMSYRMLVEGMLSTPQSFLNAIVINLHGELMPLPPMRNYSDPAKDPSGAPNVRVVTHPENLYYPTAAASTNVTLRVYSYYDGLADPGTLDATYPAAGAATQVTDLNLFFPDMNLLPSNVNVTAIRGNASVTYEAVALTNGVTEMVTNMAYTILNNYPAVGQCVLRLSNSPLRCPSGPVTAAGPVSAGLPSGNRLYQAEYIPCAVTTTGNFNTNLTTPLNNAKNTARWIVSLSAVPAGRRTIETRIGLDQDSPPDPAPNISRTYVWVGNAYPPPHTERYQFLGDPRHCPYLDVKQGGASVAGAGATIFSNGYNWWFKRLPTTTDGYTGFSAGSAVTGWGNHHINTDIPRYFQMVREALLNTTSIFTSTNGWNFYYYGIGGEFGFDHPPYTGSITFRQGPWIASGTSATATRVDEISQWAGAFQFQPVVAGNATTGTSNQWYAKYWLGELYPDSLYSTWATIGNLPTLPNAMGGLKFYRAPMAGIATGGNSLRGFFGSGVTPRKQTHDNGGACFFNGVDGGNYYRHNGSGGAADAYALATTCYALFQFPIFPQVAADRPWDIEGSGTPADVPEWGSAPYNTASLRTTLSIPTVGGLSRLFYDSSAGSNWNASGVVKIQKNSPTTQVAYAVATGTSPSVNVGVAELAKTTLVFSLRTFLDGGLLAPAGTVGHIAQLPLIQAWPSAPTGVVGDPVTIQPLSQFSNPSAITMLVGGPILKAVTVVSAGPVTSVGDCPMTQVWYRFRGGSTQNANFYSEEYPGYTGPLTATSYTEPLTLLYNFKYSKDAGTSWYLAQNNAPAQAGVFVASQAVTNSIPVTNMLYPWNVSNSTQFPQGDYIFRAEVYRPGLPLHYSWHNTILTINR